MVVAMPLLRNIYILGRGVRPANTIALAFLILVVPFATANCKAPKAEQGNKQEEAKRSEDGLVFQLDDIASNTVHTAGEELSAAITKQFEFKVFDFDRIAKEANYANYIEIVVGVRTASLNMRAVSEKIPEKVKDHIKQRGLSEVREQEIFSEYMQRFEGRQKFYLAYMDARVDYSRTAEKLLLFLQEHHGTWKVVDGVPSLESATLSSALSEMREQLAVQKAAIIDVAAGGH